MPVIVVGADTADGMAIVAGLLAPGREIRAFVSDPDTAATMRDQGVKVALGDVSDDSHVQGAATHCFSAILVTEAASDARERAFATTEQAVLTGWATAVAASGVTRVIWVHDGETPSAQVPEQVWVDVSTKKLVQTVVDLDNAARLN